MRKLTIAISAASLAVAGAALAQPSGPPQGGWGGRSEQGPVTRADFQAQIDKLFAKLDVNGDGKLDQADRDARRAKMFDKLDTNHDGSISRAEFDAAAGKRHGRMGDRGPGKHGQRFGDAGGPGGRHGPDGHRGMGLAMIGKMADTNGDGAISKDEFTKAALAMFDRADANGDGTVTPEERKAMRQQMRGEHKGRHWGQRADTAAKSGK